MKKKMIIAAVFVFALALTASAVFASFPTNDGCCYLRFSTRCCPELDINADTNTTVQSDLRTRSNSGENYVTAGWWGTANLTTGSAVAATGVTDNVVGAYVAADIPASGSVEIDADTNSTVRTYVRTSANTGRNTVSGSGANVGTGAASATSSSSTSVLGSEIHVTN